MRLLAVLLFLLIGNSAVLAAIKGEAVDYRDNGTVLKGFIAYDDSITGPRPAVIVVHEWWGHNEYARQRAKQLAQLGYIALALDMYGDGKQAHHPKEAGEMAGFVRDQPALAEKRFAAAVKAIKAHSQTQANKIAAIGYCFGGAIVLHMARQGFDLKGVASFHGSLGTKQLASVGKVTAKVLVLNGAADPFVKPEEVAQFEQEMKQAKVDYRLISYPDAKHAFTNPDADKYGKEFNMPLAYQAKADQESWQELKRFLAGVFK